MYRTKSDNEVSDRPALDEVATLKLKNSSLKEALREVIIHLEGLEEEAARSARRARQLLDSATLSTE